MTKKVKVSMIRFLSSIAIVITIALVLTSCGHNSQTNTQSNNGKISVVATIFPAYDFVRSIAGDDVNLRLLLKPGSEAHSYEPTPQDIIAIQNCDVFIYVGGDSDEWVKDILNSLDTSKIKIVAMMDCVDLVEEEVVEGMQEEKGEDNNDEGIYKPEYDEHVWTSPVNSISIVKAIASALSEKDKNNSNVYKENEANYIEELNKLDKEFKAVAANSKRDCIIFGDRFPFRYFADEYGLKYYAAFPGCSSETEASAKTVSFLIDKVKSENIPVVFYPELSNKKVATTICESSGAKSMQLNSCHNVTYDEFKSGETYLSLMYKNIDALKEALN